MSEGKTRLLTILRAFVILRALEFVFATAVLTLVPFIGSEAAVTPGEVAKAIVLMSTIGGVYVVFAYYLPFVLVVFLMVGLTVRLTTRNLPFVNSAPFLVHSLPIMLGYFGGIPPETPFWIGWAVIVVFNFLAAKASIGWTLLPSGRLASVR